ncbi:MAG TPA: hypothetical protein VIL73_06565 [Gaiellaceae bacterium]|jgi:hypothetical protein
MPLALAGIGLCVATFIAGVVLHSAGRPGFHPWLPFAVGGAAFLIGWAVGTYGEDLGLRLDPADTWHEATKLNGWTPRTSAQLAAVTQLADEHKGGAEVRDRGGETVDVRVRRWGIKRYEVDASGQVQAATSEWPKNDWLPWLEVRTMQDNSD